MIQLERILLATDFSENSAFATNYACALTDKFNAELHVLNVIPPMPLHTTGNSLLPRYLEAERVAATEGIAAAIDSQWEEGKAVIRELREGTPFVEIIRYAKENAVDLIVMGTHGHTGLDHVLIGSVAERVVQKAPCPVLTVRPEGHHFVMP